jgi:hypothetical protein
MGKAKKQISFILLTNVTQLLENLSAARQVGVLELSSISKYSISVLQSTVFAD